MKNFKSHVNYDIRTQDDGSYVILKKYNGKLDIHSHYDTFDEAEDALDDLHTKPSQADTLKFFHDLKDSMNSINTIKKI